jgi:chaperonin cofactor prefoldin
MADVSTNNNVQLGCGTLILIAIIVMVFSGGNESKTLRGQLEGVDRKIDRLEKKIDDLSQKLSELPPASLETTKAR